MSGNQTGHKWIQRVFCPLDFPECSPACSRWAQMIGRYKGAVYCLEISDRISVVCGEAYRQTDTPFMDKRTFAKFKRLLAGRGCASPGGKPA